MMRKKITYERLFIFGHVHTKAGSDARRRHHELKNELICTAIDPHVPSFSTCFVCFNK